MVDAQLLDMKAKRLGSHLPGMTFFEVMVVIVILFLLAAFLLPMFARPCCKATRISCINNLKQIGTAYRIWENDNGDKYPTQQVETLGGMQGIISNSPSAGPYTYLVYSIMQNELGQSPKVILCPADARAAATNFYYGQRNAPADAHFKSMAAVFGSFDNTNVSYFCGVGAADTMPQSILGGDRNLGDAGLFNPATGKVTGPEQDQEFGISGVEPSPGYPCGGDAIVNTNGQWVSATVSGGGGSATRGWRVGWSRKMHSVGNVAGAGNILLGDGSAQQCTSAHFRDNWLKNAIDTGNFAAGDKTHSSKGGDIRFLFP